MEKNDCLSMYPDDSSQRIGILEIKQNEDASFSLEARSLASSSVTEPITYTFSASDLVEPVGGGDCSVIENLKEICSTIQTQMVNDENYDGIYSALFNSFTSKENVSYEFSMSKGVPEEYQEGMRNGIRMNASNINGVLSVSLDSTDPNINFSALNCYVLPDEKELALFVVLDNLSYYNSMIENLPVQPPHNPNADDFFGEYEHDDDDR